MRRFMAIILALGVLLACGSAQAKIDDKEYKEFERECRSAVKSGGWPLVAKYIRKMTPDDSERMVKFFLKILKVVSISDEAYQAVLDGLAKVSSAEAIEEFEKASKNRDYRVRVALARACANMDSDRSDDLLSKFLLDKRDAVNRAAIISVVKKDDTKFINPLIDLLEKKEGVQGTVWAETRVALIKLSRGEDYETASDWRKFWSYGKEIVKKKKAKEIEDGGDPITPAVPEGGYKTSAGTKKPRFFGTEVVSKKILFIIDISGSMALSDGGTTKVEKVKAELNKCIKALGKKARFNIVNFNSSVGAWSKKMVFATKRNKAAAIKYVTRMSAGGLTHTYGALERAFKDKNADTFMLLTDGAPTMGKSGGRGTNSASLISEVETMVRQANRHRKVKIYTFGFKSMESGAESICIEFLKRLASEHGGKYTGI